MGDTAPVQGLQGKYKDRQNLMATDRIKTSHNHHPTAAAASAKPNTANPPEQTKKKPSAGTGGGVSESKKGPNVWVKKWVDYSSKYGLGYLLSNGATGVFFNDSTKIILDPRGQ